MYIETSEGARCLNKKCENYNSYEEYDFNEVKDFGEKYYYICRGCGEKIWMD